MQIMIPITITEEFIADVICTAFEGGSNYWIQDVTNLSENPKSQYFSESVAKGDTILITDNEDGTDHPLNAEIFCKGYEQYVKFCISKGREVYYDPCDIDSEVADMILQFALFNDIIFG